MHKDLFWVLSRFRWLWLNLYWTLKNIHWTDLKFKTFNMQNESADHSECFRSDKLCKVNSRQNPRTQMNLCWMIATRNARFRIWISSRCGISIPDGRRHGNGKSHMWLSTANWKHRCHYESQTMLFSIELATLCNISERSSEKTGHQDKRVTIRGIQRKRLRQIGNRSKKIGHGDPWMSWVIQTTPLV
jgi:hypothetical protein